MFFACLKNNEKIHAKDCTPKMPVTCPGCQEPVILKKGGKIAPHFAHYARAECQHFSEGETQRHLEGKEKLYFWLKKQGYDVEMEAWLPELKQRPDLLIVIDERKIVLEYQCSTISFARLKERHEGYLNNGYEVYWLCGIDFIPYSYSERIAAFRQPNGTIICFDSFENNIYMYYHLHFNKWDKLTKKCYTVSLTNLTWPMFEVLFHKPEPKPVIPPIPMPVRNQLLILKRNDPIHREFLLKLYLSGQRFQSLPSFLLTMPTKSLHFREPHYIWKYNMLTYTDDTITAEDFAEFYKKIPKYDALYPQQEWHLMRDFVKEMENKGVLRRLDEKKWQFHLFLLLNR